MVKVLITLSLLVAFAHASLAQVDSVRLNRDYVQHYWTDTRDMVTAPLNLNGKGWKGRDWLKLAAITGTTAVITLADKPVQDFFRKYQSDDLSFFTKYGMEPLSNYYAVATMASLFLHGSLADNYKSTSTALMAFESFVVSALLVRVPKHLFGRIRPDAWWNPSPNEWEGPFYGVSFPSGHTTSVFAIASVIGYQYRDTPWIPITAYSLAGLAGMARVYDNRHWFSDVFAGAVFGIATGRFICRQHQGSRLAVQPVSMGGTSGFSMTYTW